MFAPIPLAPFLLKNNNLFLFSMLNNASRYGSARHKRGTNLDRALSRGEQHIRERNIHSRLLPVETPPAGARPASLDIVFHPYELLRMTSPVTYASVFFSVNSQAFVTQRSERGEWPREWAEAGPADSQKLR